MFKCSRKFTFRERMIEYVRNNFRKKDGFTAYDELGGDLV